MCRRKTHKIVDQLGRALPPVRGHHPRHAWRASFRRHNGRTRGQMARDGIVAMFFFRTEMGMW